MMRCNLMKCTNSSLYCYLLNHPVKTKNPTKSRVPHAYRKPDQLFAGKKIKEICGASENHVYYIRM
jgi:hypothetical protein